MVPAMTVETSCIQLNLNGNSSNNDSSSVKILWASNDSRTTVFLQLRIEIW